MLKNLKIGNFYKIENKEFKINQKLNNIFSEKFVGLTRPDPIGHLYNGDEIFILKYIIENNLISTEIIHSYKVLKNDIIGWIDFVYTHDTILQTAIEIT